MTPAADLRSKNSKPRIRVKAVCVFSAPSAASSPDVQGATGRVGHPAAGSCSFEYPEMPEFLRRSHATTFRVAADSAIHESSPISASVFSMNEGSHALIVDAHNSVVRDT